MFFKCVSLKSFIECVKKVSFWFLYLMEFIFNDNCRLDYVHTQHKHGTLRILIPGTITKNRFCNHLILSSQAEQCEVAKVFGTIITYWQRLSKSSISLAMYHKNISEFFKIKTGPFIVFGVFMRIIWSICVYDIKQPRRKNNISLKTWNVIYVDKG
jgi:hypothetical protein